MNDKIAPASKNKDRPYRVLARKYRPRDFTDLIGQEPMVRTLTNSFETGRIAQAWMLTGVRGVGKTTTARILARALNYQTDETDRPSIALGKPGSHCDAIMEGRHVDVIEMDAASHTGIDAIRDIIDQVRYAPVAARYKVYIIDEVHMLTTQAFNGLLKTLEEPPPHVKFIFATTEIRKVPITVLSRCQRFDLRRVDANILADHLKNVAAKEEIFVEDEAVAMIARAAEGSVRDSLSIFDQAIAHGGNSVVAASVREMLGLADRARVIDLFEKLMAGDIAAALSEFRTQYDLGADPAVILTDLAGFVHLVTRLRFVPEAANDAVLTEDERKRGSEYAAGLSIRVLSRAWQMLISGIDEVQRANRPLAAAEMVLIRIAHAAELPTLEDALASLQGDPVSKPRTPERASGNPAAPADTPSASARPIGVAQGSRQAMRIVEERPAKPEITEKSEMIAEISVTSLEDIAQLADRHRDLAFKVLVKNNVRLVAIEPGRMEISLVEGSPRSLPVDLSRRLGQWTGRNWFVSVSAKSGGLTLAEAEANRRDSVMTDARADPTVAAVLSAFPGAKIIDVRLPASEESVIAETIDDQDGDLET